jgi:GNAT superfamily N-acetyltransferase
MRRTVTIWHLELRDPLDFRPVTEPPSDVEVRQVEIASPEFNRYMYTAVGGDWWWVDRLSWTWQQWLDWLQRPEVETWCLWVKGTPAGYFELEAQEAGSVEIVYIGLLPQFVGQGLGGWLLTAATRRARQIGGARVWLHTCSLDHPGAVTNYKSRGFRLFKEETVVQTLPTEPPGAWPGAERPRPDEGGTDGPGPPR